MAPLYTCLHAIGGKFVWGKKGVLYDDQPYLDQNDPNYDSEDVPVVSTPLCQYICNLCFGNCTGRRCHV